MILILGPRDIHTEHVARKIRERGGSVIFFDTQAYPGHLQVDLPVGAGRDGRIMTPDYPQGVAFSEIQSVYWYSFNGVAVSPQTDPAWQEYARQEIESALGTFFRNLSCLWVNPPEAVAMHRFKVHQLEVMHRLGCNVPNTLVTNTPQAVLEFVERHHNRVICKPITEFGLAEPLTREQLTDDALAKLAHMPVQLQSFIEGTDIRVHVVGEALFPTEIRTETAHYKTDQAMKLTKTAIPPDVERLCLAAARELNMALTGIDMRRTAEGNYVFLEANPSPQFMIFEERTPYPISDCLAELLLTGTQ